jgi:hypothetical protein
MCFTVTWSWSLMIDGATHRKTQSVSQLDVHIFAPQNAILRILTVVWNSWLTSYLDLWSFVRFPHRLHDLWSYLSPHRKSSILGVCQKCANSRVLGGVPKTTKNDHFGGSKKDPKFGGVNCPKPVPGGSIVWWYPPNYLLFRYPVRHPKTLFLVPKCVLPVTPRGRENAHFGAFCAHTNLAHF